MTKIGIRTWPMKAGVLSVLAALMLAVCMPTAAQTARNLNDFGVGGILDIPSARMSEDGTLALTYSRKDLVDLFNLTYQATPWLETTFRYAMGNPRASSGEPRGIRDRSFEVKLRLLQEGRYLPEVAAGIRDLVGTGAFSGEYLVGSKAFGPFDVTLGLGWGNLAERDIGSNPLTHISSRFETRSAATGRGGDFRLGDYFSGRNVGLFGGFRYQLPRWNLALVAAYNSDDYSRSQRGVVFDTDPWSFGVEWEPLKDIAVAASWQQGDQFALRFSTTLNTGAVVASKAPNRYGAPGTGSAPSRRPRRNETWYDRMVRDANSSGLLVHEATQVDDDTLNVVYTNRDYQYQADAIRRTLALAEVYAPRDVRTIILTDRTANVATHSIHHTRRGRVGWAADVQEGQTARDITIMPPLRVGEPDYETGFRRPNVSLSGNFGVRPYLFDPEQPFLYQAYLRLNGDVDFGSGWGGSASWVQNIHSQFDRIKRTSNSVLPRVRSEVVQYLQQGKSGVDRLAVTKRGQLSDEIYYLGFAGILEEMYSGVGGEILYRPLGSRFAFGASLIGVQKRDFDKRFGHQDFSTLIGHLSVYWASPLYNYDVAIHAGRYLARDVGATLEIKRRFANGWIVGVFATLTDVPFDEFGEGSFDKGLTLRIPFNTYLGANTRRAYSAVVRPIQRDGGQRLNWGTTLWETHRYNHNDYMSRHRSRMVPR